MNSETTKNTQKTIRWSLLVAVAFLTLSVAPAAHLAQVVSCRTDDCSNGLPCFVQFRRECIGNCFVTSYKCVQSRGFCDRNRTRGCTVRYCVPGSCTSGL